MDMDISVSSLRVFLRVAELGSFTAAAAVLDVSQPALSRTVIALEEKIGVRLFDRHTRRVSLTPTGVEFREAALRVTGEMDRAFADFDDFLARRRGKVTIAVLPSIASTLLPASIAHFRHAHPDVVIQIRDGPQEPVLDDVIRGIADFAVTIAPPAGHELNFRPLYTDKFMFVAKAGMSGMVGGSVSWEVFGRHPFIALHKGSSIRLVADRAFSRAGLAALPTHECSHPATVISLVLAGMGTAALPYSTLPADREGLLVADLENPSAGRSIGIVTHAARTLSPVALELVETIKAMSVQPAAT